MDIPPKYEDARSMNKLVRYTPKLNGLIGVAMAQDESGWYVLASEVKSRETALRKELAASGDTIEYMRKERVRAEEREAALREELAGANRRLSACINQIEEQQQRLTVAEQRSGVLEALLPNVELALKALNIAVSVYDVELAVNARRGLRELIDALKPDAERNEPSGVELEKILKGELSHDQ